MQLNGSQMILAALKEEKVDLVFGYPGGAIMNVYDEIHKQNYTRHILSRHEQAAIHSADGYARASGKVGVAIVTSGPGITNAITGLATAYTDSIPLVCISGQVNSAMIGTDAFQEIDAVGLSRSCTKHNYLIKDLKDIPRVFKEAFHLARSGRAGPVHIDISKDATAFDKTAVFDYSKPINMPTYKPTIKGNANQIKKAITAMSMAKKPLLYVGGGAVLSNTQDLIREFIDKTKIPAVETLMARGVVGCDNPYLIGMVGMHGEYAANMAMYESDLIISFGARFDDRVTGSKLSEFGKFAKIIHVDIDPSQVGKVVKVDYPIVGDLKNVLVQMMDIINSGIQFGDYTKWRDNIAKNKQKEPLRYSDSNEVLKPQWVIEQVGEFFKGKAIVSTDVGQHQMWTAQFYPFSNAREFITSGGLGTMGFGFPAAMGCAMANKDKVAINITGDGSFLMNIQELVTCADEDIKVINIVLNNRYLGMVRQWQTFFYEDRFSQTDLNNSPNFVEIAKAFGAVGLQVKTKDELKGALQKAFESKKSVIIDVITDRREEVFPMVATNKAINDMYLFKDDSK